MPSLALARQRVGEELGLRPAARIKPRLESPSRVPAAPTHTAPSVAQAAPSVAAPSVAQAAPTHTAPSVAQAAPSVAAPFVAQAAPSVAAPFVAQTAPGGAAPFVAQTAPGGAAPFVAQTAPGGAAHPPESARGPDPRDRPRRVGGRTARVLADAFARGEIQTLAPTARQESILRKICRCRTAAMGATRERCRDCDFEQTLFCSCGDRNCPLCLSLRGERWLRAELKRALPCAYFHLVFTLPPILRPVAQRGDAQASAVYGVLFRAARAAIDAVAREGLGDPKARLAITEVLHTWNRHHEYHPHVHAIVSAGALSADGERWLEAGAGGCLLPPDALRLTYRTALGLELSKALRLGKRGKRGGLVLTSVEVERIERSLQQDYQHVHSKAVLDPEQALAYLARYTARPGFSDARLLSYDPEGEGEVIYRTKRDEEVRCARKEFVRRLLTHMLPKGFHRVRRYSLVAPRGQAGRVAQARRALGADPASDDSASDTADVGGSFVQLFYLELGVDLTRCPKCNGHLDTRRVDPAYLGGPLGLGELYEPRAPS